MPVSTYRERNVRPNAGTTGERFASNPQARPAASRKPQSAGAPAEEKKKLGFRFSFGRLVSQTEIGIFTRQFSVMLDAGLPLVQCLDAIAQQHTNLVFKSTLEQIRSDVEAGSTLSEAMSKHPRVFDNLYTNMIAAGEAGGILDTILQRLAVFIEKLVKLKSALRSAMIYPCTVMTIAVGVVTIILWKVVPVFRTLFAGFNVDLPLATRVVIALSNFVSGYALFILIVLGIMGFGLRSYYNTDKGRHVIDRLLLKLPILGNIFRKVGVARFTRTLATLLTSGVPILEALDITAKTSGNAILEDVIYEIRRHIEGGKTISEPMRESGFFPPMVSQMVSVGESTGELDTMLVKVADYYEDEVDTVMANLLTILEPVMLVFLGVAVGGIVIAMYLPLFKLIQVLSGG
jgi:type IV pilus assembly protein PilC